MSGLGGAPEAHEVLSLRQSPHDDRRKTRGQDGSLLLSCRTLSFPTTCRFIPAHAHLPAHVFDPSAGKQGGHQSHAGTAQARLQPGHDGHIYTSSHGTKTQSAEWSDSSDPRPRYGACNWGVSLCLFVPAKKPTNLGKCSCGTAGHTDLAVLLFLFVPTKNRHCSSKWLIRFGVPDGI